LVIAKQSTASRWSIVGLSIVFFYGFKLFTIRYMKKIVFVCHGNICRSVAAEYIMKSLTNEYDVVSRATSYEEINNDIYPPMKKVLLSH
jgi:hypothetical protein